jgi:hypothetical protein
VLSLNTLRTVSLLPRITVEEVVYTALRTRLYLAHSRKMVWGPEMDWRTCRKRMMRRIVMMVQDQGGLWTGTGTGQPMGMEVWEDGR